MAVQCTRAGSTCFCASMGTGPEVTAGHDIVLTELDDGYVAAAGSDEGARSWPGWASRQPPGRRPPAAGAGAAAARAAQGRPVVVEGLRDRLMDQLDNPRWAEVADRCLACSNCTMVCPTCFCTERRARLRPRRRRRRATERRWDSCFTGDFARVAGGNFRPRRQDRYRQWLTHKFATWVDQFGTSGCVGCGRCITWCPVGIDVREELAAIAPPYPGPARRAACHRGARRAPYVTASVRSVSPRNRRHLDPPARAGR